MLHPKDGLLYMAARDIFRKLGAHRRQRVKLGAFEIYRGVLYDMLSRRQKVTACELADGSVKILGLRELECSTYEELVELLQSALANRSIGTNVPHLR